MNAAQADRPPDSVPVQLTRMEGTLNLINFQLAAMTPRVDNHDHRIGVLELDVQRLGDAAKADKLTVEQTAKALKDAKDNADATARAELQKSESAWTPVARLMAVTSFVLGLLLAYFAARSGG